MATDASAPSYRMRRLFVLGLFALGMLTLVARAADLQLLKRDFLRNEGDARQLRVLPVPAHRGMITDRNGEPLAISTPIDSVWANPQETLAAPERLNALARVLDMRQRDLEQRLNERAGREFVYLRRHVTPGMAAQVRALDIPGVGLQREYRRYYPMAEVSAHVLGFTDIDDRGQEGMELAYDEWLVGSAGAKRVIRDRLGRVIRDVESIRPARPGRDLALSIDQRLQYLAYRELKAQVQAEGARGGSVVILDVQSGEVLAMVNQPSYNPNNRGSLRGDVFRNRAVTDLFEPGSTIKPFTVVAALESGRYRADSIIDTSPGRLAVGRHLVVKDFRDYGRIDMAGLLVKSSNVAATRIALGLEPRQLWSVFQRVGFGQLTSSGFPGEAVGQLPPYARWREVERATLSYGYGLSMTPLQLAQAYAALGNDGEMANVTFLRDAPETAPRRVINPEVARQVRHLLEGTVSDQGTGARAAVAGYRIAGKTGTARKSVAGGYSEDRYIATFAGIAPLGAPRLAMVVTIDEPSRGDYYGGLVAAPVFGRVMAGALRLLDVAPDDLPELRADEHPREGGPA
ncbi:MAG: penicillin-binding transpeptidase domain-containing protein [Chromatiales bacterium]|nr:penicillin-binding transpeptidase domain-containing protein [Chromatiales bacterium]MDX9767219.1 penicillin-binding transpeptidase domain-containing protein [Ectothiorhodospiraceae bacterium]